MWFVRSGWLMCPSRDSSFDSAVFLFIFSLHCGFAPFCWGYFKIFFVSVIFEKMIYCLSGFHDCFLSACMVSGPDRVLIVPLLDCVLIFCFLTVHLFTQLKSIEAQSPSFLHSGKKDSEFPACRLKSTRVQQVCDCLRQTRPDQS